MAHISIIVKIVHFMKALRFFLITDFFLHLWKYKRSAADMMQAFPNMGNILKCDMHDIKQVN